VIDEDLEDELKNNLLLTFSEKELIKNDIQKEINKKFGYQSHTEKNCPINNYKFCHIGVCDCRQRVPITCLEIFLQTLLEEKKPSFAF